MNIVPTKQKSAASGDLGRETETAGDEMSVIADSHMDTTPERQDNHAAT
jgi:hypothetical protein